MAVGSCPFLFGSSRRSGWQWLELTQARVSVLVLPPVSRLRGARCFTSGPPLPSMDGGDANDSPRLAVTVRAGCSRSAWCSAWREPSTTAALVVRPGRVCPASLLTARPRTIASLPRPLFPLSDALTDDSGQPTCNPEE